MRAVRVSQHGLGKGQDGRDEPSPLMCPAPTLTYVTRSNHSLWREPELQPTECETAWCVT